MRVLVLTRYDRLGPSSRMRSLQFFPFLRGRGIDVSHLPLLPDAYLRHLYAGKRLMRYAVTSYLKRLWGMRKAKGYDLLWVEKELFPWLPYWADELVLPASVPYIADYDDAIFHNYDLSSHGIVRWLLRRKIDRVMANASAVTAGNQYLAERAGMAGARRVEYLPTVVDLSRYPVANGRASQVTSIGWIGTPATAGYLLPLRDALLRLSRQRKIRIVLVGSGPIRLEGIPVEIHTWFEQTEYEKLQQIDIGIMPLPDEPWERGKCGYKLIQYMACGKPVVASPVGINREIVDHGRNGFLAATPEDWFRYLEALVANPVLRKKMGEEGRSVVEKHYSLQVIAPRVESLLREVAGKSK